MNIDSKRAGFLFKGVLVLLAFISFFKTLSLLNETLFANGWDSYFYLDQVKHWFENGALHTKRYSLYYPYLILIQFFTNDYILTYKIGVAFCIAILTFISGMLPYIIWKNKVLGFALAVYVISSLHITYFGANFAKNFLGITLLFILIYVIALKKSYHSQLLLLLLGLFIHKLTAVLGVLIFTGNLLFGLKLKISRTILITSGTLFTVIVSLFYFINKERQSNFISLKPQMHIYEFYKEMGTLSQIHHIEFIMLFVCSIILLVYSFVSKSKKSSLFYIALFLVIGINFPFMKWDLMGYSYRLFILFPFLFVVLISSVEVSKRVSFVFVIFSTVLFLFKGYNPKIQDPPYAQYQQMVSVIKKNNIKSDLIIVHKPLAEFLSFNLNTDVMPWLPEYEVNEEKCWRIVYGMSDKQMDYYSATQNKKISIRYHLVREKVWSEIISKIKEEDIELFNELKSEMNPHKIRPAFLK